MGQASDLQTSPAELDLVRAELESHWVPFTDNKSFKDDPRFWLKATVCISGTSMETDCSMALPVCLQPRPVIVARK